jgi:hypothetical protein
MTTQKYCDDDNDDNNNVGQRRGTPTIKWRTKEEECKYYINHKEERMDIIEDERLDQWSINDNQIRRGEDRYLELRYTWQSSRGLEDR